jgi:hypothetical protein
MQAITTRYRGPTDTKGSSIRASCDGGSASVSYDSAFDTDANHYAAVKKLCDKLGWDAARFFGGNLPAGGVAWVPVFTYDWEKRQKEVSDATS